MIDIICLVWLNTYLFLFLIDLSFTIRRGNMNRRNMFLTNVIQNVLKISRFHIVILKDFLLFLFLYYVAGIVSFVNFLKARKLYYIRHHVVSDCEIWKNCIVISALLIAHCPLTCLISTIGYALLLILLSKNALSILR